LASNKKTIVLGLDYSEFDGGISAVNRKMSLLDQEFKLASELAQQYGSETDKLGLKQEQLTQKIVLQSLKVEEAKKKYNEVMSSQDKFGKKADDADKALLKERTALEKLNNELASNQEKLDKIAMSEVDRKMQLLQQEFDLATEKTKSFATETEQLSSKSGLLSEKIALQSQKLQISKKAYEDAKESGEKNAQQLDVLYSAYIQNETALERLNNELNDNNQKIVNSETSTRSFGDTIRSLAGSLGIDVNPAVEALASKFDGISEAAGVAILTIGTMVTALGKMTLSTAETAGEIDELSHKTGLTTDTIQEFNYAAEYLEISAESIGSSIAKMTRNMDTARTGTGDAAEAFTRLRVRITESNGQLRDSEQVFYDVIDALGSVKNETERNALSMSIFGKSAMDLNNLILEGSQGVKGYAKEAHEMGYVIDNETIQSFNNMDDSMVEMNNKFDAVKYKLGEALLPIFQTFADVITSIPTEVLAVGIVLGGLALVIGSVAMAAGGMAIANTALAATNTIVGSTGLVAAVGMGPILLILLAVAVAIGLIVGRASGIKSAMNEVKESVTGLIDSSNKALNGATDAANNIVKKRSELYGNTYYAPEYTNSGAGRAFASGTNNFPGGKTWVGENGPEIAEFPPGTTIKSNAQVREEYGNTFNINMSINASDIDEIQKVISVMNSLKQVSRQRRVKNGRP
jgi:hypothetical protein